MAKAKMPLIWYLLTDNDLAEQWLIENGIKVK